MAAPKSAVPDGFTSFLFQPGFYLPAVPSTPSNVVAADPAPYKRQNLVNILRPLGVDTLVLKAIKAIANTKTNGVVVGNAAFMVS